MIKMKQPSLCFNACDMDWPRYQMWRTIVGPKHMTPKQLVEAITLANFQAIGFAGSSLVNVIINSHGGPGGLNIGGVMTGATMLWDDLGVFSALKPFKIGAIWLVSCRAAQGKFGVRFCHTLAQAAGTQVIAADDYQSVANARQAVGLALAFYGHIDDFEGTLYSFSPAGGVVKGIDPSETTFSAVKDVLWSVFGPAPEGWLWQMGLR